eukprot:5861838-Pyramimonas_sp.AAC.1
MRFTIAALIDISVKLHNRRPEARRPADYAQKPGQTSQNAPPAATADVRRVERGRPQGGLDHQAGGACGDDEKKMRS